MLRPDTSTRSNCRPAHHAHEASVARAMTEPARAGRGRLPGLAGGEIFFDASSPGHRRGGGGGDVASEATGRLRAQSL